MKMSLSLLVTAILAMPAMAQPARDVFDALGSAAWADQAGRAESTRGRARLKISDPPAVLSP